ncbi:MAG: hypothetical protein M1828_002309 [Chrysothrix sp. TS-e1954]|nr:MAG: hypothetical protein M1828_002309 [Chrysothrix sp. TS-e1954]
MYFRSAAFLLLVQALPAFAPPSDWERYLAARQTTPDKSDLLAHFNLTTGADIDALSLYGQLIGSTDAINISDAGRSLNSVSRHHGQQFTFVYNEDTYDVDASQCALGYGTNVGSWTFSDGSVKDNITMAQILQDGSRVKKANGGNGLDIIFDQAIATLDGVIDDMQEWYDSNVCLFGTGSMTAEVANLTGGMRTLNQVEGNHWALSISTAVAGGIAVWGAQEIAHHHPAMRQAGNAAAGFVPVMASALIFWIGRRPRARQGLRDADVIAAAAAAAGLRRSSRGIRYAPRACFAAAANAVAACWSTLTGNGDTQGGLVPAFSGNNAEPVGGGSFCVPGGDIEMGTLNIGGATIPGFGIVDAATEAAQYASNNAQLFCPQYNDPYAS